MKRTKHLSTTSKKLTSVPELPFKKGLLNSSPKLKEKRTAKQLHDKNEPMVLRSPPTGESIVRYALPIPSSKTKDLIAEDEMVRRIAKHLKTVVSTLEDTYGVADEDGERTPMRPKAEGVSLSVGDDMNSFLLCCSQFAAQLEEAVKEERNILESLFKWFQQQVNQMEEIGKDQSILEADLPSDDKSVNLNIAQIANLVNKFEDLKSRLREHKGSLVSKYISDKETPPVPVKTYEGVEKQIEDFIKSHSTFESQLDSEIEPEAPYSVTDRMNVMMNIFNNQTNMLERALNDQSIIETKYKQMEADFQVLLVEKTLLEGEIRRLRESEKAKPTSKEERSKKPAKPEKKKDKDSERKTSPIREVELIQIQKEAEALKMEKAALQEQLKWALQEAERNKTQLDYILHQEVEVFKEERSKTKLERAFSKSKLKGETSKTSQSMEKVAEPSGQKQDHGKSSPEKRERLVDESLEKRRSISADLDPSALEGFYGVSDVSAFAALPFTEEHLESSSALPKGTEMWSLVSFPDLDKEIEKAEASEQILFHTEENSEALYERSDENYAQEDRDLLPEDEASRARQLAKRGRRKPLFITAKKPEFLSLLSRTQSEIDNLEAIKYESVTTREEESDRAIYEELPKAKAPAKKRDTAKRKGLAPPNVDADGSISPGSQASSTKSDTQTKKPRLHKRERPIFSNGTPDKSFEAQDAELKSESQAKKLKFYKKDVISSEVSDRSVRSEDLNVQSSSQIQLKKQRSMGGEILTIHFAAPDESYVHLHPESSSESQTQLERGTTSEDARLSRIPYEYQKKDLSVDNLLPEKKPLLITRKVSQNKKSGLLRDGTAENENVNRIFTDEDLDSESRDPKRLKAKDKSVIDVQKIPEHQKTLNPIISDLIFRLDMDNVVENKLDNLKDTFGQQLLRSEFKPQSKSGPERKGTSAKSKSTAKTNSTSKQGKELSIIKGTKLLEQLKAQHDVGLLKIKPQENITATKYQPPKKFPTKVINLSPFLASQEENMESTPYSDEIQRSLYRKSRGSSGIPATFQQMINSRKTAGDPKPKSSSKEQTELENQLHISITSSKKYVHKEQSKHRKLRKKGVESQSSIHPSASSIKKKKLKEQPKPVKLVEKSIELPNSLKMPASTPKIKVIKELSKTSHLEGKDVELSNNLSKSKSAIKNSLTEEPPKPVNLNDQDAIILYNLRGLTYATNKDLTKELSRSYFYGDVAKHSSIMSMSAARKSETKETFKLTNLDKKDDGAANNLQMSNLAAIMGALKEPTKPSDLDKSGAEDILHMSASALIRYFLKGSSKTSDIGKKVSKRSNTLHKSTSSLKKRVRKERSKTKKLRKNVGEGTPTRRRLIPAKKKRVLKEPSKISNLDKQIIKGTNILRKSNSALKKRVPKEPSKTSNLDKQIIKGTNTLRKSNSALKKRVPKGQPKPITLDKKGVDLPNNLVSSTSASSKHRFKG